MGNGQTKAGGSEESGGAVVHHQQASPEASPAPAAPAQHSEAEVAKANAQNRPPSGPKPARKQADAPKGQLVPPNRVHEMMQRTSDSAVGQQPSDSQRPQVTHPEAKPHNFLNSQSSQCPA